MDRLGLGERTLQRLNDGVFCPYLSCIDTIVGQDLSGGYSVKTLEPKIRRLATLGEWLNNKGIVELGDMTPRIIEEFVRSQPPYQNRGHAGVFVLPNLVTRIRQLVDIPEPAAQQTKLQPIVDNFKRYLQEERGLAERTIAAYAGFSHAFLSSRFGVAPENPPILSELCPADIIDHTVREARAFTGAGTR